MIMAEDMPRLPNCLFKNRQQKQLWTEIIPWKGLSTGEKRGLCCVLIYEQNKPQRRDTWHTGTHLYFHPFYESRTEFKSIRRIQCQCKAPLEIFSAHILNRFALSSRKKTGSDNIDVQAKVLLIGRRLLQSWYREPFKPGFVP